MPSTKRLKEIILMRMSHRRLCVIDLKNAVEVMQQLTYMKNSFPLRPVYEYNAFASVLLSTKMFFKDDPAYRRYSLETPTQKICCLGKEKLSPRAQILPPLPRCGEFLCLAPWIQYFLCP